MIAAPISESSSEHSTTRTRARARVAWSRASVTVRAVVEHKAGAWRAAGTLGLDPVRAARWFARREAGTLDDAHPQVAPLHALLDHEKAVIVELFET
jgi:hypothetical protein